MQEILKGALLKKSDAHHLFKVDPSKVDRIYDIVIRKLGHLDESQLV